MALGDRVIGHLPRAHGERVIVRVREYKGTTYIDIRVHYLAADGNEWLPMKKGVSISQTEWADFKKLMVKADAHAPRAGKNGDNGRAYGDEDALKVGGAKISAIAAAD